MLVAVLGWFFPARWALIWIGPRLSGVQLYQVHGLVWHGRADRVLLADGRELGRVRWQVSRLALVAPAPLRLDVAGPQFAFSGSVQAGPNGQVRWDNVAARADLGLWHTRVVPTLGQPLGELWVAADHAVLQNGWPLQLDVRAHWSNASLRTPGGNVALGEFELRVTASAGVIDAKIDDADAGPLQVAGTMRLSPLGWWLDARLRARHADPALQRWLTTLGTVDAGGSVHLQRRGGLALLPVVSPAPAASAVSSTRHQRGRP